MSEINVCEAPQGYIAVEPMQWLCIGSGGCNGCFFYANGGCLSKEAVCWAEGRKDGQDVIFKPVLH